jgi:hypothetical protein
MNLKKSKVVRISRQPSAMQIVVDQKQLEIVEYSSYLGSSITNYARCTLESKFGIAMAKAAFSEQEVLLTSKLDVHLKTKPEKRYIWSIALCGAGIWTVRKVDQKYLKCFETWCWRRTEKISWTACVEVKNYYIESRRRVISYRQ